MGYLIVRAGYRALLLQAANSGCRADAQAAARRYPYADGTATAEAACCPLIPKLVKASSKPSVHTIRRLLSIPDPSNVGISRYDTGRGDTSLHTVLSGI